MLHSNIVVGDNHYIQNWSVADNTARDALSVTAADVGRVAQVTGTQKFFVLVDDSPMTWTEIGGSGGAGTVTSVTSANADATVATTTTTPVITIVQAPALRSASTTVDVSSATAPTNGQVLTATSGTAATWQTPSAGGGITLGTPQASTSGTSIDFTGIPSGTKQIVINFIDVSTNGSAFLTVQIGDSGGIETTGYVTGAGYLAASNSNDYASSYTAGFATDGGASASWGSGVVLSGSMRLFLENSTSNTWVYSFTGVTAAVKIFGDGYKTLSAELDRVRITTTNGTDAFDAGEINIQYQS